MLILSRKEGESFMIGDSIEIMAIRVHGKKVRMGIKAPKNVVIHRIEVYQKIKMAEEQKCQESDNLFLEVLEKPSC